jgi:8-oxo-dGTP pyrophosphatase MutT (NUDIX family)
MNYKAIEDLSAEELIKAGKQDSERLFNTFLNADSLLMLTPEEKVLYSLLFHENTDQKVIAEKLGISHNSFRVRRSKLYEEYIRSKLHFVLLDMIFAKQPKRLYNKKPVEKQFDLTQIPYFAASDSVVAGFADNKDDVHTNADLSKYVHATTIIVMGKILPDGELIFLVCDKKAYNMDNLSEISLPIKSRYDTPAGGHLERQDMPEGENRLSDEAFYNCAVREFKEEIYLRKSALQPKRLMLLFRLNYNGGDSVSGRYNNEHSYVYFYPLEFQADVRVREIYTDTIGKTVKRELSTRYFSLNDLSNLPQANLCDGLGRVLNEVKRKPKIYEKMKSLF